MSNHMYSTIIRESLLYFHLWPIQQERKFYSLERKILECMRGQRRR